MFEELHAPLPDKDAYLSRIGISTVTTPDLSTLNRLIQAQKLAVPFENLDVFDAETEISLAITDLFDKIVVAKRGGYCFELNALFMSLLKSVGFECCPIAVRVVWSATGPMPITHRASIVTIDGIRYFCDVGFGGPSPNGALKLDERNPQSSGSHVFVFAQDDEGDTVLYRQTDDGKEQLLKFSERTCIDAEFLAPNEYQSKNKNSGFKQMRVVNILTESGSAAISDNVLRLHQNGALEETTLETSEQLKQVLRDTFGINVDFDLKM